VRVGRRDERKALDYDLRDVALELGDLRLQRLPCQQLRAVIVIEQRTLWRDSIG
jgi:hypothetical protein